MIYPTEAQITEYFSKLPTQIADDFAPLLERAQREYRRVWQLEPLSEEKRIAVLSEVAGEVFKTRVAKRLREHDGDSEAFRTTISIDGGDAEMGFWYAHRLYNLVERGRMLNIWHRKIEPCLWARIEEAENLWYTPELVPEGWASFLAGGPQNSPNARSSTGEVPARAAGARRAPAEYFEAYRAKNPGVSYRKLAGRVGISYESLFTIKGEQAWVRDYAYAAAAGELGCSPEDLHPRHLPRLPRRPRSGPNGAKALEL